MTETKRDRLRVEQGTKRVRAYLGGHVVADTVRPVLVWESPHYPAYYFPVDDVRTGFLTATDGTKHSPSRGDAKVFTVTVPGRTAENAAWRYEDSPVERLRDLVRLDWDAMDGWFEEDEEVFIHPRSPFTRIDILASSREVRVELDGEVIAESRAPKVLYETGLPPRFYLPKTDVRLDLLEPSTTVTGCPYKGTASHLSARVNGTVHADIAWTYPAPLPESAKIAGLVSFYDRKVKVFVDGEPVG
ncbi:DUF427 domain-containing protein [Wenjunlia tyrosinilytica]|uniref:DUF427 domain-containing protein n=1 Tax=Wenjunlia tyrosinilytica TaxID=1544741 RepID=A0A917ZIH7_9ACTN|nr:DUF427 domain-containing protein [Wenjunlia tyrosinilytica]GGO82644.1 hypothetical protein GCM10012280_09730 [Wenjunlia tyrosinilytica]